MAGHRLPLTPLLTAIYGRLTEVCGALVPEVPVFHFVQQGQAKPYIEMGDFSWIDASEKQGFTTEINTDLYVYSDVPEAVEVNALCTLVLEALTREPPLELTDGFRVVLVRIDGEGSVRKESDEIGIYWHGSLRVRWRVHDEQARR